MFTFEVKVTNKNGFKRYYGETPLLPAMEKKYGKRKISTT